MKKYAVIVAGGTGSRMKSSIPKQFLLINNKPVLYYTIRTFLDAWEDLQIILVLPEEHIARGQELIDAFFDYSRIQICMGGETRFHSVQNGLRLVRAESIVFVHDAVRCLLSKDLLQRCNDEASEKGTAIPVTACKDSLRIVYDSGNTEPLERNRVKLVQTPQVFHSRIILPAFNIDYKEKFTDEATVVEAFGMQVNLVEGEETNIKITHPIDLEIAKSILAEREKRDIIS
ncbi:MAG: 2-C-methyl-D-erythritol 4-phosphate cytidylyltransferase [Ferruginibacter sp.]